MRAGKEKENRSGCRRGLAATRMAALGMRRNVVIRASKQVAFRIARRACDAEVLVGQQRRHTAARCTLQIALLDQKGLDHILDGVALLADGSGKVFHAYRTT